MTNSKVSFDVRTWMMLMGMLLTAIVTLSSLALIIFKTRASAAIDHSAHEQMPAHSVQVEVNKNMHEKNKEQQKKIDAMYDNVLLIGERVRAKNLQRVKLEE